MVVVRIAPIKLTKERSQYPRGRVCWTSKPPNCAVDDSSRRNDRVSNADRSGLVCRAAHDGKPPVTWMTACKKALQRLRPLRKHRQLPMLMCFEELSHCDNTKALSQKPALPVRVQGSLRSSLQRFPCRQRRRAYAIRRPKSARVTGSRRRSRAPRQASHGRSVGATLLVGSMSSQAHSAAVSRHPRMRGVGTHQARLARRRIGA